MQRHGDEYCETSENENTQNPQVSLDRYKPRRWSTPANDETSISSDKSYGTYCAIVQHRARHPQTIFRMTGMMARFASSRSSYASSSSEVLPVVLPESS